MVGGVIIGITKTADRVHVNVANCPHYPSHGRGDKCPRPETCCVYTDGKRCDNGTPVELAIGDSFWWQGGNCMWTPAENRGREDAKCGTDYDIRLKKIGYSH